MPESSIVSGWTQYTPSVTGFNMIANDLNYRRQGPDILIRGQLFVDTGTATEARVSLPSGMTSISGIGNTTGLDYDIAGMAIRDYPATENLDYAVLIEPSKTYFTFSNPSAAATATSKVNGSAFTAAGYTIMSIDARIPISGYEV
jgi:hypothetical protein